MWQLANTTPFAAERTFVRDREGGEVWIVAVKATYAIGADGRTELAEEQEPVVQAPVYSGEPGRSSLIYESDLVHTKVCTDIILHGHAYAPGGRPATEADATLRVGKLSKTLRVVGDRTWQSSAVGPVATAPEPFERMPIVYERAYGGSDASAANPEPRRWETRNPVGTGFGSRWRRAGAALPNVEYPGEPMRTWRRRPRPAGFGPIPRDWSPRRELAGTYDAAWEEERLPLLPLDFDDRFYQCAPEDQQATGFLRGGEPVELYNLTPGGSLRFALPRVYLTFSTRLSGRQIAHHARLHTVMLEPDHPRAIMVWHTSLPCQRRDHELEMTRIQQKEYV